jgi:hypothetical protein
VVMSRRTPAGFDSNSKPASQSTQFECDHHSQGAPSGASGPRSSPRQSAVRDPGAPKHHDPGEPKPNPPLAVPCPCGCGHRGFLVNREKCRAREICCSRNSCPQAIKYKRYKLRKRLNKVAWKQFLTVTMDGDGGVSLENLQRGADAINRFMRAVREYTRQDFQYIWIRERGERYGRLHMHILWTAGYIPQAWLSGTAAASGFGIVLDVRSARGFRNKTIVESYVSKLTVANYVAKLDGAADRDRGFPSGTRLFQTRGVPSYEAEAGWAFQTMTPDFEPIAPTLLLHLSLTDELDSRWRRWVPERLWAEPYPDEVASGQGVPT